MTYMSNNQFDTDRNKNKNKEKYILRVKKFLK